MTRIVLGVLLLTATAFGQPWSASGEDFSPFRLEARVRQLSMLEQIDGTASSDGLANPTVTDYTAAGAAGALTIALASTTPTARRGSGNYIEMPMTPGAAGDYVEFDWGSAQDWTGYNYLSFFIQSTGTTAAAVKSQCTLTITDVPTTTDTFTLDKSGMTGATYAATDTWTWTFLTADDYTTARVIVIGLTTGATCVDTAAAINATTGGLGFTATTTAVATDTGTQTVVITYDGYPDPAEIEDETRVYGDDIACTETFTAVGNVFDAGTLGTTTAGVDATYYVRFQNGSGSDVGIVELPAIATLGVWVVMEVPLYGVQRRNIRYMDWVDPGASTNTLQIERMMLSEYANGGGPVHSGALAAVVRLKYGATSVVRGDLVGRDSGTMAYYMDQGASNENFPMGYVIGGAGGGAADAGEQILIQINGQKYIQVAAGSTTTADTGVYAVTAQTVDSVGASAVSIGTACEAGVAGQFVEVELNVGGGMPTAIPVASLVPGAVDEVLQTQAGVVVWSDDILTDSINDDAGRDTLIGNSTGQVAFFSDDYNVTFTDGVDDVLQMITSGGAMVIELDLGANEELTIGDTAGSSFNITMQSGRDDSSWTSDGFDLSFSTLTAGDINLSSVADFDWEAVNLTFDMSGTASVSSVGNSKWAVDTGNLTLETTTSGDIELTSVANFDFDAVDLQFDMTGVMLITSVGNSSIDATSGNLEIGTITAGDLDLYAADVLDMDGATVTLNSAGDLGITGVATTVTASGLLNIDAYLGLDLDIASAAGTITAIAQDLTVETTSSGTLSLQAVALLDMDAATLDVDVSGNADFTVVGTLGIAGDTWSINTAGVVAGMTGITTTGVVDADSFTSNAGEGLDTQAAGALALGVTNATSIYIREEADLTIEETGGTDLVTLVALSQTGAGTLQIPDLGGASVPLLVGGGAIAAIGLDIDPVAAGTAVAIDVPDVTTQTAEPVIISVANNSSESSGVGCVEIDDNRTGNENDAANEASLKVNALGTYAVAVEDGYFFLDNKSSLTLEETGGSDVAWINAAALGGNRILTVPDPGGSADFVMNAGNQTIAGTKTFSSTVAFSGGQTRRTYWGVTRVAGTSFLASSAVDSAAPPTSGLNGTAGQMETGVLQFDADDGGTGDDVIFINWEVPPGYITDSLRLEVHWITGAGEAGGDNVRFIGTTQSVAHGEALDVAGTAWTPVDDTQYTNTAGQVFHTEINVETEDIVINDHVILKLSVDEDECELGVYGTLDVIGVALQWESNE